MAELEVKLRYQRYREGHQDGTIGLVIEGSSRLLKAELELSNKKADRVAAHERHLKWVTAGAKETKESYDVGRSNQADYAQAEYERLNAEIELEREKAK